MLLKQNAICSLKLIRDAEISINTHAENIQSQFDTNKIIKKINVSYFYSKLQKD